MSKTRLRTVPSTEMEMVPGLRVPDIARLPALMRKEIYDRLDNERVIAMKVWNGEELTVSERFIAYCLGYFVTKVVP